jgi:hypothetical protein
MAELATIILEFFKVNRCWLRFAQLAFLVAVIAVLRNGFMWANSILVICAVCAAATLGFDLIEQGGTGVTYDSAKIGWLDERRAAGLTLIGIAIVIAFLGHRYH